MKLSFPCKIEVKNNICINMLGCEDKLVFPIYISDQKFKDSMDLLSLNDDDKLPYGSSKISTDLCLSKQKKNKKWFCRSCLRCFSGESVLTKHKEDCSSINGKESVKLSERIIEFENYFKQISATFKIYADYECNLRGVESYEGY